MISLRDRSVSNVFPQKFLVIRNHLEWYDPEFRLNEAPGSIL